MECTVGMPLAEQLLGGYRAGSCGMYRRYAFGRTKCISRRSKTEKRPELKAVALLHLFNIISVCVHLAEATAVAWFEVAHRRLLC